MALTRARLITASGALGPKIEAVIAATLCTPMDGAKLLKDARDMRDKLAAQFSAKTPWNLKFATGGLVDIEFIAQFLQLRDAAATPAILSQNTVEALQNLQKHNALSLKTREH